MGDQFNIRNFCIISHIDHGKSTLADRFLELTKTVDSKKMKPQFLDMMELEREKGITIKLQPVRMEYILNLKSYILNLIDTPGHVDFSYEVSRSLAAVEGAILLVDIMQGIQAQTLANLELAKKQKLTIIPALNKIDLLSQERDQKFSLDAQPKIETAKSELSNLLGVSREEIFLVSAKNGWNIAKLLEKVVEKIPEPKGNLEISSRALIFDLEYDSYKGVVAYVRVVDGEIKVNEKIYLMATETEGVVKEVGFFKPDLSPKEKLRAGEIGYIATGIKEVGKVRVGDTITKISNFPGREADSPEGCFPISKMVPLLGYKEPKPVVFASIYPENPDDYDILKDALVKLKLNDPSFSFELEASEAFGRGYLCGFLGTLHAEIIGERLKREFGLNLVITSPGVIYRVIDKADKEIFLYSAQVFPDYSKIKEIQEPWAKLEIVSPVGYLGKILEFCKGLAGKYIETKYFGANRAILIYEVPLREIISGFYDKLKGISQGYASLNYEILDYRVGDLVKLEIFVAGKKEEAFSKILPREKIEKEARKIVEKLKEILPPQQFSVALQAVVSGRIIARETIRARRKDVTGYLYGGDYTRKRKLLEKQKKGKKRLKEKGRVNIPSKVFFEMFRTS